MTAIALMSEKRQNEIVGAVKAAADLVSDGSTPTEAIVKAAGDITANEHELQRMVEAYNTSATLAHMKTADDKAASFPLADYEAAKGELFPMGEKAKVARARTVKQANALEIPDLRMEKVACFYGDLGNKYKVIKGEHKDSKGTLVSCDSEDIEEQSMDGKTVTTKRTETATAILKIGDKEVTFSSPDVELRRDYDNDGASAPCCMDSKIGAEKVALDADFWGRPGDRFKIKSGEHKGSSGVLKSFKKTRKESRKLDGKTQHTSKTMTCDITLTVSGDDVKVAPEDIERDYDSEKTSSARDQKLAEYLTWAMEHGSRVHTGMVTPEDIDGDRKFQAWKQAREKTASALFEKAPEIPRDTTSLQNHALRQCEHWKKVARVNRQAYDENRGIALTTMNKIAEVFRRANRPNWATFEGEVIAVHGKEAGDYLDTIFNAGRLGSVKCERTTDPVKVAYINDNSELHKLFKIFKFAAEIAAEHKAAEKEANEHYEEDRGAVLGHIKSAGMMMTGMNPMLMAASLAGTFDNAIQQPSQSKADVNPNVGLESELGKARLQAAVKEMMTDDDVIAQHAGQDPAKVMKIIEQLSQVHPKILEMPSVLQSGVRKALELGSIEPFELKQLQSLGEPTSSAPAAR